MLLNRRTLLTGVAASVVNPAVSWAAQDASLLTPRPASVQLLPVEYPKSDLWLFGDTTPGPEIRVRQGDRVVQQLTNQLPQATSIHWHGIRIANAMDGVPGLTQEPVAPGESFDYDFVVPDAGTYWYHSHNQSTEQVARGLYGPLIVEETDAPDVDAEHVLVLDDWLLEASGQLFGDFGSRHERSHAGRVGNYITTNGMNAYGVDAKRHQRLRLRLINASNARIFELGLQGLDGWIVALDGMPLQEPERVQRGFLLAPAQRVDLVVDVTAEVGNEAYLVRFEDGQSLAQTAFTVSDTHATVRRNPVAALPPNPTTQIVSLDGATKTRLIMEGGAMGRLRSAMFEGEQKSFRQLVKLNQFWAFNGEIGLTEDPLVTVDAGETVELDIVNDTSFPHGMHLHGQHFQEVLQDGSLGPLRDTLLVFGGETRKIAFSASNPGDWLFHCHMLSHQDAGMKTWMRVRG